MKDEPEVLVGGAEGPLQKAMETPEFKAEWEASRPEREALKAAADKKRADRIFTRWRSLLERLAD